MDEWDHGESPPVPELSYVLGHWQHPKIESRECSGTQGHDDFRTQKVDLPIEIGATFPRGPRVESILGRSAFDEIDDGKRLRCKSPARDSEVKLPSRPTDEGETLTVLLESRGLAHE